MANPRISVIVNFYNMQREAARTLYSLSRAYQTNAAQLDYDVYAIDNGSTKPLSDSFVKQFGENFHYIFYKTVSPSPVKALNQVVQSLDSEYVMCLIDGARMLSPGILSKTNQIFKTMKNPFVLTLAMHLGKKIQNEAIKEGYNQEQEDALLGTVDWHSNGYSLFTVSTIAPSSGKGFFSQLNETNCFGMRRDDFVSLGGFDERFQTKGGGLVNFDLLKRVMLCDHLTPVMVLGEASFHQVHGGVATNAGLSQHPWEEFALEYETIHKQSFEKTKRDYFYYGDVSEMIDKSLLFQKEEF